MNIRNWLLHLYPHAWRQRYEEEFVAVLEAQPLTMRDLFDIIIGALDARIHPSIPDPIQAIEQIVAATKGAKMKNKFGLYHSVPGQRYLEIVASYNNKQTIEPRGLSVAKLRERAEGDLVTLTGVEGDTYKFSLAPWAQDDGEQTFLFMKFGFTPEYPVSIDQTLLMQLPVPPSLPQPPQLSSIAIPGPSSELQARLSSDNRAVSVFAAGMLQDHKIMIRAGDPTTTGISLPQLLALPAVTSGADLPCPLCAATIHINGTLERLVNKAAASFGGEQAILEVSIIHPGEQAETKIPPANYPFNIQRYWRFTPIDAPTLPDPDPLDTEHFIAVRSHNHFITIQSAPNSTPASTLLSLPDSKQTDIVCPLCDTVLHSREPLEKAITLLADDAQEDTTGIKMCISHPTDMPETKTPPTNYPFHVLRHEKPLDNDLPYKLRENSPTFVVRPKK